MNELNFNFSDLYKKIQSLDESVVEPKDELTGGAGASDECGGSGSGMPLLGEEPVEECGMAMMSPMSAPKQSNSVTMNVSMNGSGAGGIKDLMQILRNIESGSEPTNPHPHDATALFGDEEEGVSEEQIAAHTSGGFDNATTRPNEVTLDIDSAIPTGNDMHSKGGEAEKVNGGGNPYNALDESLKFKLFNMYSEIKGQ